MWSLVLFLVSAACLWRGVHSFPERVNQGAMELCATGACPTMHGQTPNQGTALTAAGKANGGTYTPGETINLANSGGGQYQLYASANGQPLAAGSNEPVTVTAPQTGTLILLGMRAAGSAAAITYQTITLTSAGGGTPPGGGGGGGIIPPPPPGGIGGGLLYPPPPPYYGGISGGSQGQTTSGGCGMGTGGGFFFGWVFAVILVLVGQRCAQRYGDGGAAAASLPKGWQATTAPDGRVYFYNAATGATSWERPQA